jgi:hypothetical protein
MGEVGEEQVLGGSQQRRKLENQRKDERQM